jgi:hypothetical protein
MSEYLATLSLPRTDNSPIIKVAVTADSENEAIDAAFDKAFADYPQYGGFQIDDIERVYP